MTQVIKRFYRQVALKYSEGSYMLTLDGRPVNLASLPALRHTDQPLMTALAQEWDDCDPHIDLADMPLTRLLAGSLQMTDERRLLITTEIAAFADTDVLFYQEAGDSTLAQAQIARWGRWITWAQQQSKQELSVTHDILPLRQSEGWHAFIEQTANDCDPAQLIALHQLTIIYGSFILAYAAIAQACTPQQALDDAWLESDTQQQQWGEDESLTQKRAQQLAAAESIYYFYSRQRASE